MTDLYKAAAMHKIQFASTRGALMVQDLFDLPLISKNGFDLDTVAKTANRELKELAEESFVERQPNSKQAIAQLKLDIVKDVIQTKQEAVKAQAQAKINADEKQRLLGLLAKHDEKALEGLSREELEARIAALG